MSEFTTQKAICKWLRLQYPNVIFNSDRAGVNLPIKQASMLKDLKCAKDYPDIFIAEPKGKYHGMYIELKNQYSDVYLKSGKMTSNAHIQGQNEMLYNLRQKGYWAEFCFGFDGTIAEIKKYMEL